jgi:C4-dicarboxylate-specific signal transduction histidine kinase
MSLNLKIILIILVVILAIGGVIVLVVGNRVNTSLFEAKKETINLVSIEQSHETAQLLLFARQSADVVPAISGVRAYLEDKNRKVQDTEVLHSLIHFGAGRKFLSVYLLDTKGVTLVSTDPVLVGADFSYRKYFQGALGGENVTEMAIGSVTKQPGFYFSAPIKDVKDKVIGVAVVKLDTQPVYETLMESYINRLGKFMLVNDDGVIIFTNKKDTLYKSLGQMSEEAKKEISSENRYLGKEILPLDYGEAQKWVEGRSGTSYAYEFYDKVDKSQEMIEVDKIGEFPFILFPRLIQVP